MIPPPEHEEKLAIVTGASRGIGAGLVTVEPFQQRRSP
jgi:short-subunit dehydrogenase